MDRFSAKRFCVVDGSLMFRLSAHTLETSKPRSPQLNEYEITELSNIEGILKNHGSVAFEVAIMVLSPNLPALDN